MDGKRRVIFVKNYLSFFTFSKTEYHTSMSLLFLVFIIHKFYVHFLIFPLELFHPSEPALRIPRL